MRAESAPTELSRQESLRLLASVPFGRVVFTMRALPAVHPVRHIIDGHNLIIRSNTALAGPADLLSTGTAAVVAYQADSIDADTFTGWSVVITGLANLVTDASELARYQEMLSPWELGEADYVVQIKPELITGIRLGGAAPPAGN